MTGSVPAGSEPAVALDPLAVRIGHDFADRSLLRRALAHRSWCAEHDGEESNERLEFLGDAVLGWVVADLAYQRFADVPEGRLTDLRKAVVNTIALAAVAEDLDLGSHVLLGKGEAAAGGAEKPSILADVFEAVLGAVYLDGGTDAAYDFVERFVGPRMASSIDRLGRLDHKTALQELCAAGGRGSPVYEISAVGPDHAKVFTARVLVDGQPVGEGQGRSKKAAEQVAAREAYDALT